MRLLLDTNVLIELEDSGKVLERSYAQLFQLATTNGHQLLVHPASIDDILRDANVARRESTLSRLAKYPRLESPSPCPWNDSSTSPNDAVDNALLYAVEADSVHALITEDERLHRKAIRRGLRERIFYVQTAEDWLRRLHGISGISLPSIQDVPMHRLIPELSSTFFDSLREGYGSTTFDQWFRDKSKDGRNAWLYRNDDESLGAICIYALQNDQKICDDGTHIPGRALKLCTFKVGDSSRGRKVGELFLKAAFRFASANQAGNVFIEVQPEKHSHLINLLEDFGFRERGAKGNDAVYLKDHPQAAPPLESLSRFEYHRRYYPHFRIEPPTNAFLIPIQPGYHDILFPDCGTTQQKLFRPDNSAGNAIKLAYLCHAQTGSIAAGDVVLFYRSGDERTITSLGVVESYVTLSDAERIAQTVSRRTVYSFGEIARMAKKPTRVMLFRLALHLPRPVPYRWLFDNGIVNGYIQSITRITEKDVRAILEEGSAQYPDLHPSSVR